jgi:hypothetical protein
MFNWWRITWPVGFKCLNMNKEIAYRKILRYTIKAQIRNLGRYLDKMGGTRCRSWLKHCATSRNVAGSIPDGVIGFFHWKNPSGRTMALGLTQPLREMSTRNISWG